MVKDVHQKAAGGAGNAAEHGTHGHDGAHLQRPQPQIGGDDRGQQGDAVGVEMLKGVRPDEGGGHHRAFGARHAPLRAGRCGGTGRANCCLRHNACSSASRRPALTVQMDVRMAGRSTMRRIIHDGRQGQGDFPAVEKPGLGAFASLRQQLLGPAARPSEGGMMMDQGLMMRLRLATMKVSRRSRKSATRLSRA